MTDCHFGYDSPHWAPWSWTSDGLLPNFLYPAYFLFPLQMLVTENYQHLITYALILQDAGHYPVPFLRMARTMVGSGKKRL